MHARVGRADLLGPLASMAPMHCLRRRVIFSASVWCLTSLIASCWSAPQLQDNVLAALEAGNLSLVETGMFGEIRSLSLSSPVFKTRKLSDHGYLMGVSSAGDRLLMNVESHKSLDRPEMPDEVDITDLKGKILVKIGPPIRGMLAFGAELSPDGRSVAFGGHFARLNARGTYGLHLLTASGNIRTLVATTEAQTPLAVGWSHDSKTIAYDLNGQLLMYHLETNTVTALTEGSRPAWSPDGLWIAYRTPTGTAALIRPDGTGQRAILQGIQLGWGVRWAPDSRHLLFTDAAAGSIRVLDVQTGRTATILEPADGQYTEATLRWVRGTL